MNRRYSEHLSGHNFSLTVYSDVPKIRTFFVPTFLTNVRIFGTVSRPQIEAPLSLFLMNSVSSTFRVQSFSTPLQT